ncbi:unnamed protein product [Thlaspi arvense]|uniref:GDSL esterase/lipase n=1 Tax=Thlaspi arvense TaxID=13288 RepID=A0AAU9RQZ9_THLAR|nr:unnamed protein product [Thlaspi arvense]
MNICKTQKKKLEHKSKSKTNKTMKLQMLWLALILIAVETNAMKQGQNATIPALIVFGDSIMDTGNKNYIPTFLKCNFPPYAKDFPGSLATGRFSDGRVPSNLIVEKLGLGKTLRAYMNPNLKPEELLKGLTFASGGTGYDPLTAKIMSVISISNDLAHTYLAQSLRYDRTSYANFLADSAVKFVKELHKLGAQKIGVFSAVPIGCVPLQRTLFGGILTRGCVKTLNNMAKQFNSRLSPALDSLDKELDDFKVADRRCCGNGLLAVSFMCNSLNPFTCSNSSAYIFWDTYHPTERAYQVIVDNLLDKYLSKII